MSDQASMRAWLVKAGAPRSQVLRLGLLYVGYHALVKKQEISELFRQIFSWISERVDIWNINEYPRDFLL